MEQSFISLLWPDETSRRADTAEARRTNISEKVCEELGLSDLLTLSGGLTDYFTSDPAVILYRQKTLADLARIPLLSDTLARTVPILCDIRELRHLDRDGGTDTGDAYLYSITEIELYVRAIDTLAAGLADVGEACTSPAFRALADRISAFARDEDYLALKARLGELSAHVNEVRSVTIGVNLDAACRPVDAGVIRLNAEPFKSGRLLDKILRMSFKNDAMTCIAPLTPLAKKQSENRQEALSGAFKGALEDIFRSSVKSWRAIVGDYVLDNADFLLKLLPEIEFVTRVGALEKRLTDAGYPLTTPVLRPASEKAFDARGLYNPDVALRIDDPVVPNDLTFDDNARIYVLTGPNRGGKSVITCAVGLAQAMTQLGMRVAAEALTVSPADGIFTHFPEGAEDTIDKGRLGEECARLREIFEEVTGDSMILLDESLSSTGAFEASYIAAEILTGFAVVGCRGIFSTHLHELASAVPEINERAMAEGGVHIDTLVAGIEEGRRSFLIKRARPDGRSYARDIAEKYGLSLDGIRALTHRAAPTE